MTVDAAKLELRRKSIYASLIRFSPETTSLRERVLDRLVLTALSHTSESKPVKFGGIQTELGSNGPALRENILHETLDRLAKTSRIETGEDRGKKTYRISGKGRTEVAGVLDNADQLFKPVFSRMLKDIDSLMPFDKACDICQEVFARCFSEYGREIAKIVTNQVDAVAFQSK